MLMKVSQSRLSTVGGHLGASLPTDTSQHSCPKALIVGTSIHSRGVLRSYSVGTQTGVVGLMLEEVGNFKDRADLFEQR